MDEAEAALQQVQRVKVPDVAGAMPRLIRVPVNASRFESEHELRQVSGYSQGDRSPAPPSFLPSLPLPPPQTAQADSSH